MSTILSIGSWPLNENGMLRTFMPVPSPRGIKEALAKMMNEINRGYWAAGDFFL